MPFLNCLRNSESHSHTEQITPNSPKHSLCQFFSDLKTIIDRITPFVKEIFSNAKNIITTLAYKVKIATQEMKTNRQIALIIGLAVATIFFISAVNAFNRILVSFVVLSVVAGISGAILQSVKKP